MTSQLSLLDPVCEPDEHTNVCALIDGDPVHARDRAAVVEAVVAAGQRLGVISANDWRDAVPDWVYPKVIGAVTSGLIAADVLVPLPDPVRSDDRKGRNSGRWISRYRYVERGAL